MKTTFLILSTLMIAPVNHILAQSESADSIEGACYDLEDIVVVADKPIVQSDGAKLTYNMDEDPSSKGNTLIDALRKVPMITIDGEDNIMINGQSSFKIYVNGKEDPSLTSNYKNIFKAMPADAVVKVEVITEPGAKYDAEGTAGIINLITLNKTATDGYSGSVQASFSKSQTGGSLYGRMKKKGLSMSANLDYANGSIFPQKYNNVNSIENSSSEDMRYQISNLNQYVKFNYIGAGINISYDISDKDLLTANGNLYSVRGALDDRKSTFSTETFNANNTLSGSIMRSISAEIANTGVTAGTSWQHDFDGKGHKTILSYQFSHGYDKLAADENETERYGITLASPFVRMDTRGKDNEHTLQFDYINPLGTENHSLETGAKAIWRRNNADSYQIEGTSAEDATGNYTDLSDLTQIQDIYALYVSYNGTFGNLHTTAGVRYEHTRMGIDFHTGEIPDFMNYLNDIVPNAALSYSFSPASNIRLAYQMRISRPSLSQVNPFRQNYIPNYFIMGNPDLGSEHSNKVSLTYSNFGRVIGGSIGIEYAAIDNSITHYFYVEDGDAFETYANLGHDRRLMFSGLLNWTIIPRMQFSVNARLSRQMFSSPEQNLSNKGWNLNYGANWNYSLASGFKFNLYGGQKTRSYQLSGHYDGWYYYGLGISKDFLKDNALTITLNANNFLQKYSTFRSYNEANGIKTGFQNRNSNWNVGLSLNWRFGSLKSDVKKTDISISNDDKSDVKSNGSF